MLPSDIRLFTWIDVEAVMFDDVRLCSIAQ